MKHARTHPDQSDTWNLTPMLYHLVVNPCIPLPQPHPDQIDTWNLTPMLYHRVVNPASGLKMAEPSHFNTVNNVNIFRNEGWSSLTIYRCIYRGIRPNTAVQNIWRYSAIVRIIISLKARLVRQVDSNWGKEMEKTCV